VLVLRLCESASFIINHLAYTNKHHFIVYGAAFILCFALRNSVCVICEMSRVVTNILVEPSALIRAVVFPLTVGKGKQGVEFRVLRKVIHDEPENVVSPSTAATDYTGFSPVRASAMGASDDTSV
jgi:hypothetical protein